MFSFFVGTCLITMLWMLIGIRQDLRNLFLIEEIQAKLWRNFLDNCKISKEDE
jgi:hypothetical protein